MPIPSRVLTRKYPLLLATSLAIGCSDPAPAGPPGETDASADVLATSDLPAPDSPDVPIVDTPAPSDVPLATDATDASTSDAVAPSPALCRACMTDGECGANLRCVAMSSGARACVPICNPDVPQCPRSFRCVLDATSMSSWACVPLGGSCCLDDDGDGFGQGIGCMGPDCDDGDRARSPGVAETCNGRDDDCDGTPDDGFDLRADPMNCGACGTACGAGSSCDSGRCVMGCVAPTTSCAGRCVNTATDVANCGSCGRTCAAGQSCVMGACAALSTCASARFDGSNQITATPSGPSAAALSPRSLSMAAWFRPEVTRSTLMAVVSRDARRGGLGHRIIVQDGSVLVRFQFAAFTGGPDSGAFVDLASPAPVSLAWHHVVATYDAATGNAALFLDGASVATGRGGSGLLYAAPDASVLIGADYDNAGGVYADGRFRGSIADVRFFDRALSMDDAARVRRGESVATPIAHWPLAEGSGSTAGDLGPSRVSGALSAPSWSNEGPLCVMCAAGRGDCDRDPLNGCETDLNASNANCGACGTACSAVTSCAAGRCVSVCVSPTTYCSGACVNTASDAANCGACGTRCPSPANASATCTASACGGRCNAGFADCNTSMTDGCEVDTRSSTANCGACGRTCSLANASASCDMGACAVASCNAGYGNCDGSAANGCETALASSVAHCGMCGRACSLANATPSCASGACAIAACTAGFADCDAAPTNGCEADIRDDATNCGACGRTCAAGQSCVMGACAALSTCASARFDGSNQITATLSGPSAAALSPRSLSMAAWFRPEVTRSTLMAVVSRDARRGGLGQRIIVQDGRVLVRFQFAAFTGGPDSGAFVDLASPTPVSLAWHHVVATYDAATGNAALFLDGASVATGRGGSGLLYAAPDANVLIGADYDNAGGVYADGRFRGSIADVRFFDRALSMDDAARVRRGEGVATPIAHWPLAEGSGSTAGDLGPSRVSGALSAPSWSNEGPLCVMCAAGRGDCDRDPLNGCEADLNASNANCGACGTACSAGTSCTAGRCVSVCMSPTTYCAGSCVNTATDAANCGACGTRCPSPANASATCTASACGGRCNAGFADCNTSMTDGCEVDTRSSTAHCGACGRACSLANASASCDMGACAVASCNAGYGNCDGSATNGCETALASSVAHCGMCGRACSLANATPSCASGACAIAACTAGYADCDAAPTNGCEVDTRSSATNCGACGHSCGPYRACAASRCACASASFDGSSDVITVPGTSALAPASVTLSLWVRPATTAGQPILTRKGRGYGGHIAYGLMLDAGRFRARFQVRNCYPCNDLSDFIDITSAPITAGRWYHVAATYDASTGLASLYVDGALATSLTRGNGLAYTDATQPLALGADLVDAVPQPARFAGLLANVTLLDRAASPTDVASLRDGAYDTSPAIAHWPLDEAAGTLARDRSPTRADGTLARASWASESPRCAP